MYAYKTGSTTERNAGQPSFNILHMRNNKKGPIEISDSERWGGSCMVLKRVWTMPVGMNKCVFRAERRTFERSIIAKWTFLLTREDKIKKGFQGWNYRQGELQERLRGTQYEACPQMTGETSLGAQESSERKRCLPCPQTKTVPNTRTQGNWRQEARILRSGYPSSTLRAVVSPRRT